MGLDLELEGPFCSDQALNTENLGFGSLRNRICGALLKNKNKFRIVEN